MIPEPTGHSSRIPHLKLREIPHWHPNRGPVTVGSPQEHPLKSLTTFLGTTHGLNMSTPPVHRNPTFPGIFRWLVVLAFCAFPGTADGKEHIIFLTLDVTEASVQVIGVQVRPGKLKSLHSHTGAGALLCDLLDADGKTLWRTVTENPLLQRFEYADSAGNLHSILSQRERARTTVRLRFVKGAHSVQFSVGAPPGGAPVRHLGTVLLNIAEEETR